MTYVTTSKTPNYIHLFRLSSIVKSEILLWLHAVHQPRNLTPIGSFLMSQVLAMKLEWVKFLFVILKLSIFN